MLDNPDLRLEISTNPDPTIPQILKILQILIYIWAQFIGLEEDKNFRQCPPF
jgi:hypothetical protein